MPTPAKPCNFPPCAHTATSALRPIFSEYPKALDGCSDLLVEVLRDAGKHVLTVMGVCGLHYNVPRAVDAVFEIRA